MHRGTYRTTNEKKGDSSHQWRVTNKWLQNDSHHPLHLKKAEHFNAGCVNKRTDKEDEDGIKNKKAPTLSPLTPAVIGSFTTASMSTSPL